MSKNRKKQGAVPVVDSKIKDFLDMIAPGIIKFNTDHFLCGNTYRCVWALREYPTSTSEQAIFRHLGEKDGVTLRIYTRQSLPKAICRMLHSLCLLCIATKNRCFTVLFTLSLPRRIWMH